MTDYSAFLTALGAHGFAGDIRDDWATRIVYSTDNSIYQWIPDAVICPKSVQDIQCLGQLLARPEWRSIKITPRGGGTGTNAQSLNVGLVVDTSRYLNQILEINSDDGYVIVQPGVVLDVLNHRLAPFGLRFGPSVSPGNRATIGGMISTDASGEGSLYFGKTSQHIVSISAVTVDGTLVEFTPGSPSMMDSILESIRSECRDEIQARFPRIPRFLTGYNLDHATQEILNPVPIVAGSEGTLVIIVAAKLKLVPIPSSTLIVAQYATITDAIDGAQPLLRTHPIAVETVDATVINLAKLDPMFSGIVNFISPDLGAMNLIESQNVDAVRDYLLSQDILQFRVVGQRDEAAVWWQLRKKSVGLLGNLPGPTKPVPFIEDCVVPPSKMSAFIRDYRQLLDSYGLHYAMYGHADVGCVHVRPALDLQHPTHEALIRPLSDAVHALTQRYGGVMWGKHGKGVRGEYSQDVFGPKLYRKIREIKTLFDPFNQLNPGKLAVPLTVDEALYPIESPLRAFGDREITPSDQRSLGPVMNCNGNGACFNAMDHALMCPSYRETGDRLHSPKGRAMIYKEWVRLNRPEAFADQVKSAMDGCLSCKACTSECPVHVDIPEIRSQFMAHFYRRRWRPLRDWLIRWMEPMSPLLAATTLGRWLGNNLPFSWAGLVDLPAYQTPPRSPVKTIGDPVVLAIDPYNGYFDTTVINAATSILETLGARVVHYWVPAVGKVAYIKGWRDLFHRQSRQLIDYLSTCAHPILVVEPGFATMFNHEYRFVSTTVPAVIPISKWIRDRITRPGTAGCLGPITLFPHCMERVGDDATHNDWEAIFVALGYDVQVANVGCCGMAGIFGHERENRSASHRIFCSDWKSRVDESPNSIVTGFSCRHQIHRFHGQRLPHPLEVIANAL